LKKNLVLKIKINIEKIIIPLLGGFDFQGIVTKLFSIDCSSFPFGSP
jgi:hypothetical protein|tara:strand:- start:10696 stop:10836 length:141 start_codon:yes stop_codon:yes gene_type:complete